MILPLATLDDNGDFTVNVGVCRLWRAAAA
jgi:hypothetical protein